jgi:hypothetical protein
MRTVRAYQALVCKAHNIRDSTTAGEEEERTLAAKRLKLAESKVSRLMGFAQWGVVSAAGRLPKIIQQPEVETVPAFR